MTNSSSPIELQPVITRKKNNLPLKGTPLGNFLRGPGTIPTPPDLATWADFFDSMTMEEQRRYLDEDAIDRGLFDRR